MMEYPLLAMERMMTLFTRFSKFEDTVGIDNAQKDIERAWCGITFAKQCMEVRGGFIHQELLENAISYAIYALNSILKNQSKAKEEIE